MIYDITELKSNQKKIGYWDTKCNALWGDITKRLYGDRCVICGRPRGRFVLNTHHWFFKRTEKFTKFNLLNGIPLCYTCHDTIDTRNTQVKFSEAVAKTNGFLWEEKVGNYFTRERIRRSEAMEKMSLSDYIETLKALEKIDEAIRGHENEFRLKYIIEFMDNPLPYIGYWSEESHKENPNS